MEATDVYAETPAAISGIKPGDILLQVGQKPVRQPEDVIDASFFITAGDTVPITVMRGKEKLTFNVEAENPQPPLIAAPSLNYRAIPLNLESSPKRTP